MTQPGDVALRRCAVLGAWTFAQFPVLLAWALEQYAPCANQDRANSWLEKSRLKNRFYDNCSLQTKKPMNGARTVLKQF